MRSHSLNATRKGITRAALAVACLTGMPSVFQTSSILGSSPALAAEPVRKIMEVRIIRDASAACIPLCGEWISAEGEIVPGTVEAFRKVLAETRNRKLPILIHSGGGAVEAGLAIGRMIRKQGLSIAVARTQLIECQPQDTSCNEIVKRGEKPGIPMWSAAACASSCTFLIAGGVQRFVHRNSYVGVHMAHSIRTRVMRHYRVTTQVVDGRKVEIGRKLVSTRKLGTEKVTSEKAAPIYRKVSAYLTEMGVAAPELLNHVFEAQPDSMRLLKDHELTATRLAQSGFLVGELVRTLTKPQILPVLSIVQSVPGDRRFPVAALHFARVRGGDGVQWTVNLGHPLVRLDRTTFTASLEFPNGASVTASPVHSHRMNTELKMIIPLVNFCQLKRSDIIKVSIQTTAVTHPSSRYGMPQDIAPAWSGPGLEAECRRLKPETPV